MFGLAGFDLSLQLRDMGLMGGELLFELNRFRRMGVSERVNCFVG